MLPTYIVCNRWI